MKPLFEMLLVDVHQRKVSFSGPHHDQTHLGAPKPSRPQGEDTPLQQSDHEDKWNVLTCHDAVTFIAAIFECHRRICRLLRLI